MHIFVFELVRNHLRLRAQQNYAWKKTCSDVVNQHQDEMPSRFPLSIVAWKKKKLLGEIFFSRTSKKNCPCFLKCLFFCFFLGGFYETTCPTFRWARGLENFVRSLSSKFKFEALDQLHTVTSRSPNCVGRGTKISAVFFTNQGPRK